MSFPTHTVGLRRKGSGFLRIQRTGGVVRLGFFCFNLSVRRRRLYGPAAIVVGLLIAVGFLRGTNNQPRFEGKPLGKWLQEINSAGSLSNSEPALQAIAAMGTNSLPYLLEILSHEDSPTKQKLIRYAERANIFGFDLPFDGYLKSPACLALKTLGTNSSPIVSQLGQLARDPEHKAWALSALFSIGSAGAPGFVIACGSSNVALRAEAAMYLSKVTDGSQRGWSWGWNPDASKMRQHFGVGSTFGGAEDADAIAQQLKHTNAAVRRASADALALYCRQRKSVLSALTNAQQDENAEVRAAVGDAIKHFEAD
jgi:hypothetical protein